jgi:hypothetical protein
MLSGCRLSGSLTTPWHLPIRPRADKSYRPQWGRSFIATVILEFGVRRSGFGDSVF